MLYMDVVWDGNAHVCVALASHLDDASVRSADRPRQ